MVGCELVEQRVHAAFRLAWFILRDKEKALRAAAEAMAKVETAAAAQDKRRYYKPGRHLFSRGQRRKVSLHESHLLQRLVYIESEPYEKAREESNGEVSEEDMVVHFVKHLVRITVRRSSFYVSLAISRLLHNFTTAETMEIYNVVVQDPERVRDDHYYRSRKARLLRELTDRFPEFLRTTRGAHAEERFETTPLTERLIGLVDRCLEVFTPWNTACPVPAGVSPASETILPCVFTPVTRTKSMRLRSTASTPFCIPTAIAESSRD